MKAIHWIGIAVLLILTTRNVAAGILPSFNMESCSWNATHIVVVTEGDKIDGDMEVLASWKGDLKKGDLLSLPALAEFAEEKKRAISKRFFEKDKEKNLPASVSCSRMVLFLIRKEEKTEGKPAKTVWLPAAGAWGGIMVSTAWIEWGNVFAFAQQINPGPQELLFWNFDELGFKKGVDAIVKAQTTFQDASRGNADKLATATLELLRSDSRYVPNAVVWELRDAGVKSLPALRAILKNDNLLKYHDTAVHSLAKAGGVDAGPELVKLLDRELAYWKKVGPDLPGEWWNGAGGKVEWKEVTRLRNHYSVAHSTVIELGTLRHSGGRQLVTEFGDYWRSLPQLLEIKQLAEACDASLKVIPPQS